MCYIESFSGFKDLSLHLLRMSSACNSQPSVHKEDWNLLNQVHTLFPQHLKTNDRPTGDTLKGQSIFGTPHMVSLDIPLKPHHILTPLSGQSCFLPFHRCWMQKHFLMNLLHTHFCLSIGSWKTETATNGTRKTQEKQVWGWDLGAVSTTLSLSWRFQTWW